MAGRSQSYGARKVIALTFDDGPGEATTTILDLLDSHDAKATFFLLGGEIAERPEVVRRIASEAHELGNHTFTHPRLETLSPAELEHELHSTSAAIEQVCGTRPRLFRPPYGLDGLTAVPIAAELGMTTVRWTANPRDWEEKGAQLVADGIMAGARPGAVLVLHDGGPGREATIEALEATVPRLRADGYSFVTLSETLERSRSARRKVIVRRRSALRRLVGRNRRRFLHKATVYGTTALVASLDAQTLPLL